MAETANTMSTEFALVDKTKAKERLDKFALELTLLHEALPDELWPKEDEAPREYHEGRPFFPGRVFLGTNDGAKIFAYLRKQSENGHTKLEVWYDEGGPDDDPTRTEFKDSQFEPWCHLIADEDCPINNEKGSDWEKRMKQVVRLVMLEVGHFDGSGSIELSDVLETIHRNTRDSFGSIQASPSGSLFAPSTIGNGHSTWNSESHEAETTEDVHGLEAVTIQGLRQMDGTSLASYYAKILQTVVPPELWFKTEAFGADEDSKLQESLKRFKHLSLLPGKLLLGQRRQPTQGTIRVWAAVRKLRKSTDSEIKGPTSQMLVFDDNYAHMELAPSISGPIAFAPIFQLLFREGDFQGDWYARVSTSVRVALVHAGYHDGAEFKYRAAAAPGMLRALMEENLKRMRVPTGGNIASARGFDVQSSSRGPSLATVIEPDTVNSLDAGKQATEHNTSSGGSGGGVSFTKMRPTSDEATQPASKKQKTSDGKCLSLVDYINIPTETSPNLAIHLASKEQIRMMTEEIAALNTDKTELQEKLDGRSDFLDELHAQIDGLNDQVENLSSRNQSLSMQNQDLSLAKQSLTERVGREIQEKAIMRQRLKKSEELRNAHTRYCQPVMLKVMTVKHMSYGSDKGLALLDAKMEYTETFGMEPVEEEESCSTF
ncbi:hypothetical protein P153DRAFT_400862 [Dothidotthia symphoricarpi CBS 119687]|uniref:Uncharacterized protein n=1 Tax=Dothidotthia symphoricarpi CBS 119687 TaxID=1392245 RepID=A0A6A5ZYX3_9PLEO|nr:uncharacterized protein P153DRAFT_400862 [Dothidotthia symphoricarpi CBS 119687]KAF2124780.1 hypothetical protein P153DRAFT_400862 [Dothidotthia symphoricarpi CBS 119687]